MIPNKIKFGDDLYTYEELSKKLPKPLINKIVQRRPYSSIPSVTQLNSGPMFHYLEYKHRDEYVIDADFAIKALFGDVAHNTLETETGVTELRMNVDIFNSGERILTGQFDYLDIDEDGHVTIWDYKTSGSFFIKKWFGWRSEPVPVLDEDGNEVLLKSGKNKGKVKTKNQIVQGKPHKVDTFDYTFQLNTYAFFLESFMRYMGGKIKSKYLITFENDSPDFYDSWSKLVDMAIKWDGKPFTKKICFLPRDGGFKAVTNHDMNKSAYTDEVEDIENIEELVLEKIKRITPVMSHKTIPEEGCNYLESKGGVKCEKFCKVADFCKHKYVEEEHD